MRTLDGGNAGGQFLRTALALSAVRGEAVRIENVRGARDTPGLRAQHLAAVRLLREITDADVHGEEVGATTVAFDPGPPRAGEYAIDVGTAGSLTLLFDAVLPLASAIDGPLQVRATGGTDVKWSPTMDYFREVKLPLCRSLGLSAGVTVHRRGFYPAGGGAATLSLGPSRIAAPALTDRGRIERLSIHATQSRSLADREVAGRLVDGVLSELGVPDPRSGAHATVDIGESRTVENEDAGQRRGHGEHTTGEGATGRDSSAPITLVTERTVESDSPGAAVLVGAIGEGVAAGGDAVGERGTPAEEVGARAARELRTWLDGDGPVDRHLADQLVPFVAMVGGTVRSPTVTDHLQSGVDLLATLGYDVGLSDSTVVGSGAE